MQKRRIYFIEKNFQFWFIIKFCLLVILGTVTILALLYFFASRTTTVSFENTRAVVKSTADFIFPILIQTLVVVTVTVAIFTIMLTLYVSHKIGGPIYRFKKELELLYKGDFSSEFRIRKGDQFQDLAQLLNSAKIKLKEEILGLKKDLEAIEVLINSLQSEERQKENLRQAFMNLKQHIEKFKI